MRVAYSNAAYDADGFSGRNVHVKQFIDNAAALGHEVWTWPGNTCPGARNLPSGRIKRLLALRKMDAIYIRLEDAPPRSIRLTSPIFRHLCGSPAIVWEFNTAPEYGEVVGQSRAQIEQAVQDFRGYGKGCDLAICVSEPLREYASKNLGLKRVITVPNGSDPKMFRPDVPPVKRVRRQADRLNVVWIGSADLAYNNFDLLRETAELLSSRRESNGIQFNIIGKGLGRLRNMPANVAYHGPDDYEFMPAWLAAMDVGLCLYRSGPSDYCSPLKLFDYMASGLAVVSNRQPQVCEVFDKLGQSDLLFPPNDARALATILTNLSLDRDKVRRLGEAGRKLVIEHYNWRRAVEDTFSEIANVLLEKGRKSGSRAHFSPISTASTGACSGIP